MFLQQANLTLYMLHILYDIDDVPTPDAARSLIELILAQLQQRSTATEMQQIKSISQPPPLLINFGTTGYTFTTDNVEVAAQNENLLCGSKFGGG